MQPTLAFAPGAEDFAAAYFDIPAPLMLSDFNNMSFLSETDEEEIDETDEDDLDESDDEIEDEDDFEEAEDDESEEVEDTDEEEDA